MFLSEIAGLLLVPKLKIVDHDTIVDSAVRVLK